MTFQGFDLPDDLKMLSDTIAEFVREEILPVEVKVPGHERGLPAAEVERLQQKARDAGFWCLEAPERFGGGGLGVFEGVVLTEQMVKHRYGMPRPGGGVFGIEPPVALYRGTPQQIERYVLPTIENAWSAFSAISEPTGGSDPARAIRTTATLDGDRYRINGHKMWASGADHARYGIVYARTDRAGGRGGISAIVVDADTPGMLVEPVPVIRDHWTTELTLTDCVVPADNLIGEEGAGFGLAQEWMVRARLRYAAQAIGVAEEAVRIGLDWARSRETFGATLATRQAVQFALADARVQITAARHLTWDAAWTADHGGDARTKASIAKLHATETGFAVVDAVMQILGGMGMASEMPLEHWFRALRVARVVEGPSEIHRFVIAREMLGKAALGRA
ncbi:acyl-CoA dehydrogenase family protein [Pseudonocardia dioxanivorans]|uniref:acyl-CoA dehydrogenase family protein n=1 Tax=Pseudonocardia dioxanivorans TaxID=240495 RepID=UPI000CD0F673|nr:acyl-CoA dehydrogenase [Pseudonocardia dioxanivorans]